MTQPDIYEQGGSGGDHSLFDKQGAVGKHFQREAFECGPVTLLTMCIAEGAIGSVGESIGGPLSKEGGSCTSLD